MRWTEGELKSLQKMKAAGHSNQQIAETLGRTQSAVQTKVTALGMAKRPWHRLTYREVEWARRQREAGVMVKVIAAELGCSRAIICRVAPPVDHERRHLKKLNFRLSTWERLQQEATRRGMTATNFLNQIVEERLDEEMGIQVDGGGGANSSQVKERGAAVQGNRPKARAF